MMRVVIREVENQQIQPAPARTQKVRVCVLILVLPGALRINGRRRKGWRWKYLVRMLKRIQEAQHVQEQQIRERVQQHSLDGYQSQAHEEKCPDREPRENAHTLACGAIAKGQGDDHAAHYQFNCWHVSPFEREHRTLHPGWRGCERCAIVERYDVEPVGMM